jgi:hypothetical protein
MCLNYILRVVAEPKVTYKKEYNYNLLNKTTCLAVCKDIPRDVSLCTWSSKQSLPKGFSN